MFRLRTKYQTKTLYKLLNKWAKNYNPQNKNWRCYSYKLDEISLILRSGGFNVLHEAELIKLVEYRIKQHHPQFAQNESYIRKIAANVVVELIHRMQDNTTLNKAIFINMNDHI